MFSEGSDAIAEMMLMPNGVIPKGVARRELMLMPKGVPRGVTDAEGSDAEGSDNFLAVTKQYMYNRYPCCCGCCCQAVSERRSMIAD